MGTGVGLMLSDNQDIDVFCGAGGLTRGLIDAGLEVVAGFLIAIEFASWGGFKLYDIGRLKEELSMNDER